MRSPFETVQQIFGKLHSNRVPYLQQLTTVECGAACLAMILCYFGRQTTVAEARDACVVGRDGLRAATIAQAARRFGLVVRAFSADLPSLSAVSLPAIIHWELSHFVVLERWNTRGALIVDPAEGRRLISINDFSVRFTGVVLTFRPSDELQTSKSSRKVLSPLLRFTRQSFLSRNVLAITGLTCLANLPLVALLLLFKIALDCALPLRSPGLLAAIAVEAVLLYLLRFLSLIVRSGLARSSDVQADSLAHQGFVRHLFRLPLQFFQQRNSGDLLMRVESNSYLQNAGGSRLLVDLLDATFYLLCLLATAITWPLIGCSICALRQDSTQNPDAGRNV